MKLLYFRKSLYFFVNDCFSTFKPYSRLCLIIAYQILLLYFQLDHPHPSIASLDNAIAIQKEKLQHTKDSEEKKKIIDTLVDLRKKKHDLHEKLDQSELSVLGHVMEQSNRLNGYCSNCNKGVYPKLSNAVKCSACDMILHQNCINDLMRHCSLAQPETLELITELCPPHGLQEQNYCCFDCGTEISYNGRKNSLSSLDIMVTKGRFLMSAVIRVYYSLRLKCKPAICLPSH